jgi:phosphate-selective porin OprO and OprP
MIPYRFYVAVFVGALMALAPAIGQTRDERLEKLEQAVKALQQENAALKKEISTLKAPAAGPAVTTNKVSTVDSVLNATNRSPFALNVGKEAKLKLGGFLQVNGEVGDVGASDGNFPDNELTPTRAVTRDRIRLRRARINVSGEFFEDFDFKLEGAFEQGDGLGSSRTAFSGTDVFANWHRFPEAQLKLGQFKPPFGLEQITSDSALFTAERSLPSAAMTQDRQVGVALWGKPLTSVVSKEHGDLLEYSVGMFNGNGRNTTINDDDNFMYVGRLAVLPFKSKVGEQPVSMRFGVNAYQSRFGAGTRVSPGGNLRLNGTDGALTPFAPTNSARGTAWGADYSFNLGPFDLMAEYLEVKYEAQDKVSFNEFTANGYYIQPSYFLPVMGGKKIQVVGRWESFNPGQAMNDDIKSVVGGVTYYINGDALKVMLNYVHTWSDFRHHRPGTGEDEFDMLLARFQLMF